MAKDPYKYFRIEAKEILDGLTKGVLELEKGPVGTEPVARLLRLAHTLKGAARVVRLTRIAELAHGLEDALAPYREASGPLPRDLPSELLRAIDALGAELAAIEATREAPAQGPAETPPRRPDPRESSPSEPRRETIRLEIGDTDAVLEGIAEAAVKVGGLARHVRTAEQASRASAVLSELLETDPGGSGLLSRSSSVVRARWLELRTSLEQLSHDLRVSVESTERELAQVRERADRLRLVLASDAFNTLERATRDAAESLGKRVMFEASGGNVRLDAHVLLGLGEALLHVVRNAVAHGIEAEGERVARGKPPSGTVSISVERRAGRVAFACRDDGRGIDVEAVRRVAVARGLISRIESESLTREQAIALLMRGGVSTARALSQVAGRGVGLDAVREVVARLKGEVDVRSDARGTTVEIRAPVSLTSIPALLVEVNDSTFSLPLEAVVKTLRMADAEVVRAGHGATILHEGALVPFLPLAALLHKASTVRTRAWSVVILRSDSGVAAVGVDRVRGTSAEVLRSLPAVVGSVPLVAGAAFDADGNPRLMLEPARIVSATRTWIGGDATPPARRRPPVLVIDDSLTTRMLEQSILESAGYEVELATSAEEGLEKSRAGSFGVFVVDVEMPGMDGYDFVARTRKDPVLGRIPAILVTSRGSAEDRQRGADAGAYAYIVKGEFDQGRLLSTIAELIG